MILRIASLTGLNLLLASTCVASGVNYHDYNEINQYVASEADSLIRQFKTSQPLQAQIIDSSDPSVKSFLEGTSRRKADHLLAVQYFSKFKVNNAETSFCFIFYDSKENIFEKYKATTNLTEDEILQYLTWHEMGHCFAYHEKFIKSDKANEFVADAFALSVALNKEQNKLSTKILKHIGKLKSSDIHSNQTNLEQFFFSALDKNLFNRKLSVNEILDMIYFYYENSSLNGFEFKN